VQSWVDAVLSDAGLGAPDGIVELGGGTFNTVLRVSTRDGDVIVKVARDHILMSYEHGTMATEALHYRLAAEHGVPSVPRVLHYGQSNGREVLVLTLCPGRPWPEVADRLDRGAHSALRAAVGRELAALHRITGPGYGYPARPLAPTWRLAFTGMLEAVLDDARRFEVPLPGGTDRVAAAVERVSPVLDEVTTPALVHFDLWDGNILVDRPDHGAPPRLGGLIDAERAFWGDPVAELVSLRLFGDLEPDAGLLSGYHGAGGRLVLDGSVRLRLLLYRLYLYLIMWVEAVPRRSDAGRVAWLRAAVLAPAAAILDTLERKGPAAG
jgi:Ser/Thr protein kinase RdoA (MazF antagonist)